MDFEIDEPISKKFFLNDLKPGQFFEWHGTVFQKVSLALSMENLLRPGLQKDKVYVVSVFTNQISYFDTNIHVTLLNYTPVHFTRVV